jgi:hypothetical protein
VLYIILDVRENIFKANSKKKYGNNKLNKCIKNKYYFNIEIRLKCNVEKGKRKKYHIVNQRSPIPLQPIPHYN